MAVKKWLGHGLTDCIKCGWHEENYLTVQVKARKHAQKTGHKVSVDL
ncbi:hypothetical protein LCGC14_2948040, partial [marine sediment metagenome]